MRLRIYLLRFAAGAATFVFGLGLFSAGQFLTSFFRAEPPAVKAASSPAVQLFATPVPAPFIFEAPAAEETEPEEQDYGNGGDYYPYYQEDLPKDFRDLSGISIEDRIYDGVDTEEYPWGRPIPPAGHLEASRTYNFIRISVSRDHLSFETEVKKGVSYKFSGKFLKEPEKMTAIEGRLTKMRDGKKVASAKIELAIGGC